MKSSAPNELYNYICIEGNIGSGKTTLCHLLAEEMNCQLILEQFTDNPFLPMFYKQQSRYAFPVELFFMTERYKQLQENLTQQNLFHDFFLADYFFQKTALFARKNLEEQEYRLFMRFFKILNQLFPNPDLVVYLHRPVDQLSQMISKRNREIEKDMDPSYLEKIQNAYWEFFSLETRYPILFINVESLDFENNPDHLGLLKSKIFQRYQPGLHTISLSP